MDYFRGWETQRAVHARRVSNEVPDSCLLLEHTPVYTAGKRTAVSDRPFGDPGAPVIDVDRGGKITWHGPGQLTAYPIIRLAEPMDVVAYVRALEESMIRVCADFGLTAVRVTGRSGAWIPASGGRPDRKVGAIGARVAKKVTMHGLALNCDNDLSWFDRIVPCGISDASVSRSRPRPASRYLWPMSPRCWSGTSRPPWAFTPGGAFTPSPRCWPRRHKDDNRRAVACVEGHCRARCAWNVGWRLW